jgi:hypothetical protein
MRSVDALVHAPHPPPPHRPRAAGVHHWNYFLNRGLTAPLTEDENLFSRHSLDACALLMKRTNVRTHKAEPVRFLLKWFRSDNTLCVGISTNTVLYRRDGTAHCVLIMLAAQTSRIIRRPTSTSTSSSTSRSRSSSASMKSRH